jgi:hypothetical protein
MSTVCPPKVAWRDVDGEGAGPDMARVYDRPSPDRFFPCAW